ncbi:molybdopterin molybdotransferase MoeA [Siphonobacter sp. SORGH_AS_0500]|uniref:molybdopterin molybdotransferase MoeA n=1 Tax=Siphonobacter sp. SORGH_AS_0500 TaxID=1864824 RepID=UPI00286606AC|nr:molybdopterin molybdotransferase MoeA [Siphonobacter sp. SORGH_AS_0500]MDR6195550.1 molybdopterin molybdotransferase [Siphonobacter sp. SORGH_AS_0500]
MISVEEASQIITAHQIDWGTETIPLPLANRRILAEAITADRDFPPFHRVTMDGIAVSIDTPITEGLFRIEGTQYAGESPKTITSRGSALEVMTGAVLPSNTNTVIRYEDLTFSEYGDKRFAALNTNVNPQQNVHHQGSDRRAGEVLLQAGIRLGSSEIGILASVGKSQVLVQKKPRVAIISTGDELVDIQVTPLPHQIRKSSGYQLAAALQEMGFASELFHLPDHPESLEKKLTELIQNFEILILTGGVSAGKKDFVPATLEKLGIQKQFHKVAQRPGKPVWFGVRAGQNAVFALPGNPVSTFACFLKYVRPYLLQGTLAPMKAVLSEKIVFKPELTYFLTVAASFNEEGRLMATPLKGSGSGDFANLLACTGFLELPADRSEFEAGEVFSYLSFR